MLARELVPTISFSVLLSLSFRGMCLVSQGQWIRAARLQNETAPKNFLNRYEKRFENDPKNDPKRDRNIVSPSQAT